MKKLLLLFIGITALSCSSDDPETLTTIEDLSGEWKEASIRIYEDGETHNIGECVESPNAKIFTFNNDGTLTIYNACEGALTDYIYTCSYTFEDGELTIFNQSPVAQEIENGTDYEGRYDVEKISDTKISTKKTWDDENLGIDVYKTYEKL